MEPSQRPRRPPVTLTKQCHERGYKQGPDDSGIKCHRQRSAKTKLLGEEYRGGSQSPDRDAEEDSGGSDESSGALHSERNGSDTEPMRFLQFWILPDEANLEPSIEQRQFTKEDRSGQLLRVIGGDPPAVACIASVSGPNAFAASPVASSSPSLRRRPPAIRYR